MVSELEATNGKDEEPAVTLETVRSSAEVRCYLEAADQQAILKGYTEHGLRHASLVSTVTQGILMQLQVAPRRAELGAISGYLHDVGNLVGRRGHNSTGGVIAMGLLQRMGMPPQEIVEVVTAIANHDEGDGEPVSDLSAALILADKSDVHRSRVRNPNPATFDNHDRVNYAARRSYVRVDANRQAIAYDLSIETEALPGGMLDYFEIFLPRMLMARKAAQFLKCQFEFFINNTRVF
jgi:metal-dependent HD superfamily phosphatase/phosphodiesterase